MPYPRTVGAVCSFTRTWKRGPNPIRISVAFERMATQRWTADTIALGLVRRACYLLNCRPRELKIKHHPMDGLRRTRY
jgi:hypothetical protein